MNKEEIDGQLDYFRKYLIRCHTSVSDRDAVSYEEKIMNKADCLVFEDIVKLIDYVLSENEKSTG